MKISLELPSPRRTKIYLASLLFLVENFAKVKYSNNRSNETIDSSCTIMLNFQNLNAKTFTNIITFWIKFQICS